MAILTVGGACHPGRGQPDPGVAVAGGDPMAPTIPGTTSRGASSADPQLGEPAPRTRPPSASVGDRDAAILAVQTGNPEGAVEFLTSHLEKNPKDLNARLALARAQALLGAGEAGLRTLAPAPDDPAVVQRRATLLTAQGRHADAIGALEAGLKQHPDSLGLQGDLLALLHATGNADTPAATRLMNGLYDAYDAGRAKTAADLLAIAQAALARGTKGAFHDANMVLEEAEQAAPAKAGSWDGDRVLLLRGQIFAEKYAADEAITTYGLLLARDAWHPDALAGSAAVHVDELQFASASRLASEALAVNPEHPVAHSVLARVALIEGRRSEARERIVEHVLTVDPSHGSGLAVLAALGLAEANDAEYARARDTALERNPKNGGFFRDLSDILGFLHLYREADDALQEGARRNPEDAYVKAALGVNLLRLGEEERALAELQAAWKRDPFNERTRNVLDLYEKSIEPNYDLKRHGELTIRLPKQDREFVEPSLVASLTDSIRDLDRAYKVPSGPLRLEFFRQPDEFSVRTVGVPSLGAVAVCFGPVVTFIGPYFGVHNIDNVIRHELAHVYAIKLSRGRVPRWFTEGLSEWESELANPAWARESAQLLQQARKAGRLRQLHELELAFIRAESPAMMEVAYATSAYAVRYLGQTYGRDKLITILQGYGKGETTEVLFARILGKSLSAIEGEFEAWFFGQLDAKLTGWQPQTDPKRQDERDALWSQATAHIEHDDAASAIRSLEELVTRGGDGFGPRMQLAKLVMGGPKPQAAKRHLEAAGKFNRESVEPLARMAELARKLDHPSDEKTYLRAAITIDGDGLEPAARLIMLGLVTDDPPTLTLGLERALGTAPLHPIVLGARAHAAAQAGNRAVAQSLLERAREPLVDDANGPADTYVVLALAAAAAGDTETARKYARTALARPHVPGAAQAKLKAL